MEISVCIPTYNQAQYLKKCIESVVNQTIKPSEIIVSNDFSDDNTKEVLDELEAIIPILKIIHQPINLGMCANMDFCMREAKGDYIVKLDSDDLLAPQYCEVLSILLNEFPNAGYAHGNVKEVDQTGKFKRERRLFRKKIFVDSIDSLKASMKGSQFAANILMFRKEALESVNYLYNRPSNFGEDFHLSVDLAANGWGNVYSKQFLSFYRVWDDNSNVRAKRKIVEIEGIIRVFDDLLEPYFKKYRFNLNTLTRQRIRFACTHSNCLSWKNYTNKEKKDIENALLRLSSSKKVKLFIWANKSGYSYLIDLMGGCFKWFKVRLKKILTS